MLALICFFDGLPEKISSRVLLLLSSAALFLTMTLALGYSVGRLTGMWSIPLGQMIRWHGWFNAIGFTFFGLLAWNIDRPGATLSAPGIPFSHLPWRWHIGSAYFQRTDAIDEDCTVSPVGIVDQIKAYNRDGFESQSISPAITAFYEHTADHELLVYPDWQPGFGFLARVYKQFSQRIEQMNFPLQPESDETLISSEIIPLRDILDGREQVRGWLRVYPKTGRAVYVAAYSSHCHQECRYMNIAFPLPLGNLTSILRLETLEDCNTGLLLTSFSTRQGDQGVYFANRLVPIRLPINETIRVYPGGTFYKGYPADFPVGTVIAEHKMWILGIHCLTLHYSITPENTD
jgi:hypothetical protein